MQQQEQQQFLNVSPKNKEIFKYIEEILVTYEFRDAQIDYFNNHGKTFESPQENEQIYSDLFKEYTKIQDEKINKKLAEKFTESEILQFYKDFTLDHNKYDVKSNWINTVETLFTFTDLENFKKIMVAYYGREQKWEQPNKPYKKLDVNPDFETFHSYYNKDLSEFQAILKGIKDDEISTYTIEHNETVQVLLSRYTIKGVQEDTLLESQFKMDFEKIKAQNPSIKVIEQVYLDGEPKSDDVQIVYQQSEYSQSSKVESLLRTEKGSFQDFKLLKLTSIEHEKYPIKQDIRRMQIYKYVYYRQISGTNDTEVVDITLTQKDQENKDVSPMFKSLNIAQTTKSSVAYFFNDLRNKQAEKDAKK